MPGKNYLQARIYRPNNMLLEIKTLQVLSYRLEFRLLTNEPADKKSDKSSYWLDLEDDNSLGLEEPENENQVISVSFETSIGWRLIYFNHETRISSQNRFLFTRRL
jgi:hypothetical protein